MITVEVCIGSACYVKGSNEVIKIVQKIIEDNCWQNTVDLKGSFCMQQCTRGLGVKINGERIDGIGIHNAQEVIENKIKELI